MSPYDEWKLATPEDDRNRSRALLARFGVGPNDPEDDEDEEDEDEEDENEFDDDGEDDEDDE